MKMVAAGGSIRESHPQSGKSSPSIMLLLYVVHFQCINVIYIYHLVRSLIIYKAFFYLQYKVLVWFIIVNHPNGYEKIDDIEKTKQLFEWANPKNSWRRDPWGTRVCKVTYIGQLGGCGLAGAWVTQPGVCVPPIPLPGSWIPCI